MFRKKMGTMLGRWIIIAIILGWTDNASSTCGLECISCQENSDTCTECSEKYYLDGQTCAQCPYMCRQCLKDNVCILCDSPYFGSTYPHCNFTCPNNCNSSGCDALTGYCFGCQQGFYGNTCEQKCDLCSNGRCDRFACSTGCKLGYFQIVSSATYSDCSPCKDNCAVCSNFTYCTSCQTGFALFREDYNCLDCELYVSNCTQCSYRSGFVCDTCQDGYMLEGNQCNVHICPMGCASDCHNNGTCIAGCKAGYAGDRCDMICNLPCKSCDQFDKNKCITLTDSTNYCKITFNSNCMILNESVTCNMTGFCLNGCLNGFWDISCNRSCSGGCDGNCDRMTGECYKCEHFRYGKFCDKNCSENCLNNITLNDICTKDLGTCLHGCKPGFAGPYCTQPTPMPKLTTSPDNHESVADKNVMVGAVVGALAGGILIGAGSVAVLCILRKRKREPHSNRMPVYVNTPINSVQCKSDPTTTLEGIEGSTESSLYQQLSNSNTGNEYSVLSPEPSIVHSNRSDANLGYYNLSR